MKSVFIIKETLWTNNLKFVKEVPIMHLRKFNYNLNYIFLSKKKHYFGIDFRRILTVNATGMIRS